MSCGCTGGSIFGGASDGLKSLTDFANKGLAERNQSIINGLAKSLKGILKAGSSDPSTLFATAAKQLESVTKGTQKINESGKKSIIDQIAKSLDEFLPGSVDNKEPDLRKKAVQIRDALIALSNGVSVDFVNIKTNLETSLKNMQTLRELLQREFNEVAAIVDNSGDESTKFAIIQNRDFFERSIKELTRQIELVSALVGTVVMPADANLHTLMKESENYKNLISEVVTSDKADISPAIAYTILSKGDIAKSREVLAEVLKKVGSSISEYMNSESYLDFKDKLYNNFIKTNKSGDSKSMQNFIDALVTLEKMDYLRAGLTAGVVGGAALFTGNTSITERLRKTDVVRTAVLSDFKKMYKVKKQALIDAIATLAPKIGVASGDIQPTSELRKFIALLGQMSFADAENFERALINYTQTAVAQTERDRFLTNIRILYVSCKVLGEESGNSHFAPVHSAINDLMELVDNVATQITPIIRKPLLGDLTRNSQISGGDDPEDKEDDAPAVEDSGDNVDSDHAQEASGGAKRAAYFSFSQVVQLMNYYYVLAGSKEARKALGLQLEGIQKDASELTAKEIAKLRDDQLLEYKTIMEAIADFNRDRLVGGGDLGEALRSIFPAPGAAYSDDQIKLFNGIVEGAKVFYKFKSDARVGLLRVCEFVNAVLGAFIEAFSKDPDAIKDLNDILESIEVNHKWYSAQSQVRLKNVFNVAQTPIVAPASGLAGGLAVNNFAIDIAPAAAGVAGNGPDFIPANGKVVEKTIELMRNGITSVKVLDNIINVFMQLAGKYASTKFESSGVKGGGDSISAGFIKKSIVDYMICSSIEFLGDRKSIISENKSNRMVARQLRGALGGVNLSIAQYFGISLRDSGAVVVDSSTQLYDQLLSDLIQAMIAKPLVIAGSYSIYYQPRSVRDYKFTSMIRTILGGAGVRVHDELVESYVRLVLLAEWYRELFTTNNPAAPVAPGAVPAAAPAAPAPGVAALAGPVIAADRARGVNLGFGVGGMQKVITMIAEGNGAFSPLLELIFNKLDFVQNGGYSSTDVDNIVMAINSAYEKLKSQVNKKDVARSMCQLMVDEVNAKYGILKSDELRAYLSKRDSIKFDNVNPGAVEDPDDDIDLLQVNHRFTSLPVKSDRYVTVNAMDSKTFEREFTYELRGLVTAFRSHIDNQITNVLDSMNLQQAALAPAGAPPAAVGFDMVASIEDTILRYYQDVSNESTQEGKLKIVKSFLQGSSVMRGIGAERIAMFLDTVRAPLAVLRDLQSDITEFHDIIATLTGTPLINAAAAINSPVSQLYRWVYRTTQLPDSLIKLNITNTGGLALDISELRDTIDKLMYTVRESVTKFSTILPRGILNDVNTQINTLEQDLVRKIMKGDTQNRDGDFNIAVQKLMELSAPIGVVDGRLTNQSAVFYTSVISESGGTVLAPVTNGLFPNLLPNNPAPIGADLALDVHRFNTFAYLNQDNVTNISLIGLFNHQLIRFMRSNIDVNGKVYLPLISDFINGPASKNVFGDQFNWSDNAVNPANPPVPEGALITSSISKALAVIATRKVEKQEKLRFASVTLAEVLPSTKEKMKVTLPLFMRIFDDIANYANYNKMLILNSQNAGYTQADRNRHMQLCDDIMSGCASLRNSCSQVYKELADTPVYGELYGTFLSEFKSRFGTMPILPYSYLYLVDVDNVVKATYRGGENAFKFLYATRQLFHPDKVPTVDNVAASRSLLDRYNAVVSSTCKLDKGIYEKQVNIMLKLLRNDFSRRLFRSINADDNPRAALQNRLGGALLRTPGAGDLTVNMFVSLVSTNDMNYIETQLRGIADLAGAGGIAPGNVNNRRVLRVINFIELGIVPINIHMLQREIALANLINYSTTFTTFWNYLAAGFNSGVGVPYNRNGLMHQLAQNNANDDLIDTIPALVGPNGLHPILNFRNPDAFGNVPARAKLFKELAGAGGVLAENPARDQTVLMQNIMTLTTDQRVMNLFLRHIATRLNSPISTGYASIAYEQTEFTTDQPNDQLGGPFDQFDSYQ